MKKYWTNKDLVMGFGFKEKEVSFILEELEKSYAQFVRFPKNKNIVEAMRKIGKGRAKKYNFETVILLVLAKKLNVAGIDYSKGLKVVDYVQGVLYAQNLLLNEGRVAEEKVIISEKYPLSRNDLKLHIIDGELFFYYDNGFPNAYYSLLDDGDKEFKSPQPRQLLDGAYTITTINLVAIIKLIRDSVK